jgi:tRNA(Met) C34 N-acetyltransferase TmcA
MAKAQAWYLDVVMAVFIFTAGIIAYHHYNLNTENIDKSKMKEMSFQADTLSTELLSSGYPRDWNESSVVKVGLTSNDQHISGQKWAQFSSINYNLSKQLLGMTYDFVVFFEGKEGNVTPVGGICGVGSSRAQFTLLTNSTCMGPSLPQVSDLLVRERYVFASGGIIKMKVYVFS